MKALLRVKQLVILGIFVFTGLSLLNCKRTDISEMRTTDFTETVSNERTINFAFVGENYSRILANLLNLSEFRIMVEDYYLTKAGTDSLLYLCRQIIRTARLL